MPRADAAVDQCQSMQYTGWDDTMPSWIKNALRPAVKPPKIGWWVEVRFKWQTCRDYRYVWMAQRQCMGVWKAKTCVGLGGWEYLGAARV